MSLNIRNGWKTLLLARMLLWGLAPASAEFAFEEKTLDNGLRVVSLEDDSCPIVAIHLWYHVGSKDEDPQRQGFAHMFEHMMFRGTDRLGPTDHFDWIRRTGGNCNAYTTFDQTVYTQTVPSNQLKLVLWLEAERMSMLKIDQESFDTERKVVEEERRMGVNRPYGKLLEKVLPEVFKDHPYRWSTIGSIPHLRAATVPELRAFWTQFYVPNNATLVVVGDIQHAQVQALAEKYFGWIPRCPDPPRIPAPPSQPFAARELVISEQNAPAPIVGLMYRGVPMAHPDYYALQVMTTILGGGESSRLYRRIVAQEEAAVLAMSGAMALEQDGLIGTGAVLSPLGGNPEKVMKAFREEVARLQNEPISERELTKAKNQLLRGLVTEQLTIGSKASVLGASAVLENDTSRANARLKEIQDVTAADVVRVARAYLAEDAGIMTRVNRNLLGSLTSLLGGKDDEEAAPISGAKETDPPVPGRPGVARPAVYPDKPPVQSLLTFDPTLRFDRAELPNGLQVLCIENHEVPFVSVTLGLESGAWTDNQPGAASMALGMLTKGTEGFSEAQLAEELDTYAISIAGSASMDTSNVNLSCLTAELPRGMQLLGEVVLKPTLPADEFRKLKEQVRTQLAISSREPSYLADRALRQQLYGDHPYARSTAGELADLDRIELADVQAWWKLHARPDQATLIFAGDVNLQQAVDLAGRTFGTWKNESPATSEVPPDPAPATATRICLVDHPGVQTEIRVGQLGMTHKDPDYFVSRLVSSYFGGAFSSRLNETIRVKKGLTYGARGGFSSARFAGEFRVGTFSKNASAQETVQTILREIDRLRAEPPTAKELEQSKSFFVGSFPATRETPQQVAGEVWEQVALGLPQDFSGQLLKAVSAATAEACQNVATRHVDPARLTIVVVGPSRLLKEELEKIAPVTVLTGE